MDFKKAFNYVNHSVLIYKLLKTGISGNIVKLLTDMYSKIRGTVKVNNRIYETILDQCGSNQGGPLSPNMFRFMLADLKEHLDNLYGINLYDQLIVHLLWADDLVLMSDTPSGLQTQLDGLFTFCSRYQMIVNQLKTKIMIYANVKQDQYSFEFNKERLEIVNEYKYLGVVLNSTKCIRGNKYKSMVDYITDKSTKATFMVYKKCKAIGRVSPKLSLQLYDSYVDPVLNYSSEIWGKTKSVASIERVQLRYLKYMLGVKDSTCTPAVFGETGRFPVYVQQRIKLIKYWLRLISLQSSSLVRKAYNVLSMLSRGGFQTWANKICEILEYYGMEEYWLDESKATNCKNFMVTFIKKVKDVYITEWGKELHSFPVLRTYVRFKTTFKMEEYLCNIRDFKLRKIMSKFRLSSHKLQVEIGRHAKPKQLLHERICTHCNLNAIETEEHFLLDCPFYQEERVLLFTKIVSFDDDILSNKDQAFVKIMSCNDIDIIFSVSKYIEKCFKNREHV